MQQRSDYTENVDKLHEIKTEITNDKGLQQKIIRGHEERTADQVARTRTTDVFELACDMMKKGQARG